MTTYADRCAVYDEALGKWGLRNQFLVAIEEMSEVQKAITKLTRTFDKQHTCKEALECFNNLIIGAQLSSKGFSSGPSTRGGKNIVQYIGIAADEPNRFHNLSDTKKSPLVEIGWDEAYCRRWCEENDLLSPIYTTAARGGCWFCHNQGVGQLRLLRQNYPELWAMMLKWDADSPVSFKPDGHTIHDFDRRFQLEDEGFICADDKLFRWSMLDEELNYRLF